MTSAGSSRGPRHLPIGAALLALVLAGCATRPMREAAAQNSGEAAQPSCAPADALPEAVAVALPKEGCWNEANLARMVADPADLTRGRALSPASGAHEALAVDAYRRGRVKPLDSEDSASGPAPGPGAIGVTGP